MVFLVENQAPIGRKGQQAFGGFNVLDLGMVQLAGQLPILQDRGANDEEQQHQAEYADIPQRKTMADVCVSQHLRFVFPEHEPYAAHGMQQLFWGIAIKFAP